MPSRGRQFAAREARTEHVARPSELRRGDIWRVAVGPEIGEHPALLVSRAGSMRRRWRPVVALITTEAIGVPTEVALGPGQGVEHDSADDCEGMYTARRD